MNPRHLQWAAIVNPTAGSGKSGRVWIEIAQGLESQGINIETYLTSGPGDATRKTNLALKNGTRGILVVGGDGTINEAVNGCFEREAPIARDIHLAIIPAGTGSDFIKSAKIPTQMEAAIACFMQGHAVPLDVGKITTEGEPQPRYFVNIADVGIGGAVVERVNRSSKMLGGFASFLWATLVVFWTYRNKKTRIVIDDRLEKELKTSNVIVGNGRFFGGGMQILPDARFNDGHFDILIMGDFNRFDAYANILQVYRGTHLSHPKIENLKGRKVYIESDEIQLLDVDGEQWGQTPATFEIIPRALRLIVPQN